ncbi:MAG: hypothetical protein WHS44_04580 [Fimbriimonadales bacterium]|nr:MAG: hypothetical protein KatS3mg018_2655 [Fimbriimonadales bacterium]
MKRWLVVSAFSALVALSTLVGASAQGVTQSFTYQGYLRQGGAPLNNPSQSMRFRIFATATDTTVLWDSGALTVNVSNGLFTVQLNPPASIWTGADRYLEIQVGSTTLTPRVLIRATPYANTATQLNMFQSGTNNADRMVITHSPAFPNWGLQYQDVGDKFNFVAGSASIMTVDMSMGRVGIGTSTPAHALDVSGDVRWSGVLQGGSVPWARITGAPSFLGGSGTANRIALFTAANTLGDSVIFQSGSNIGIGTTNPTYPLEVSGGMLVNSSTGHLRIGFPSSANQWFFATDGGGANLQLWENAANAIRMYFRAGGNVGIGTTSPIAPLSFASTTGNKISLWGSNASAHYGFGIQANLLQIYTDWNGADIAFGYGSSASFTETMRVKGNGNVGIGTNAPAAKLHVNGTARVNVLEITGADFAEKFPTTDEVQPGMVVEIDPDNPGNLRLARGAYNKRVAGIVAGANGLSKGIVLGNLEGSENHSPIAISGRVWVYADATEHAIVPGDFLTTAERPGYAMKATDLQQAQGAILGKAMTRLEKGQTGFVLVLVNLQ